MFFEYALRMTKNRIRLVDLLASLLMVLAVAAGFALAMVVADHFVAGGLSPGLRTALRWGGLLAVGALGAMTLLSPLLRRISDLYVARMIERANPRFRNDLTAALQLRDDGRVSEASLLAIRRRASRETAETDIENAVNVHGLKVATIVFGAAVLLICVYSIFSPKPVLDSLRRALGDESVPAPTNTRFLAVAPADGSAVPAGRPVQFEARLHRPDGPVTLRLSRDGGKTFLDEDILRMTPAGADNDVRYLAIWTAASNDGHVRFQLACGDAKTPYYRLRVLPPPAIRNLHVEYAWPVYTGRGPTRQEGGRVHAPLGTEVRLRGEANLPVVRASLVFEKSGAGVILTPDGNAFSGRFRVQGPDRYRIRYTVAEGLAEAQTVWCDVLPAGDAPPEVRLAEPAGDLTLAANDTLALTGEATDDFGLAAVELVCRRGEMRRTIPLLRLPAPGASNRSVHERLDVTALGRAGDELICFLRARDFRPNGETPKAPVGQTGRSKEFTLRIGGDDPQVTAQRQAEQDAARRTPAGDEATDPKNDARDEPAGGDEPGKETAARDGGEPGADPAGLTDPAGLAEKLRELLQADETDAERLEELREHFDDAQHKHFDDRPEQENPPAEQPEKNQSGGEAQPAQGQGQGQDEGQGQGQGQAGDEPAGGPHAGTGGVGGGSAETRGQVEDADPAVLRDPVTAARLESLGRALKEANRRIRDDQLDPHLLKDLGLTASQFRAFVEDYTQRFDRIRRAESDNVRRERTGGVEMVGSEQVRKGAGVQVGPAEGTADVKGEKDEQLRETRACNVSPEYQKHLDAYFRAVSEGETKGESEIDKPSSE
jgi:hypothetical protein